MSAELATIEHESQDATTETSLSRVRDYNLDDWRVLRDQAQILVKAGQGILPKGIDTPEKCLAIIMKGRELGLPPMYALSNIAMVNGKPVCGAELLMAIILRDHGDSAMEVVETTAQRATVQYRRRSWRQPKQLTWTIEQARTAGLANRDVWKQYPETMLRWRAISAAAKIAFPDTIAGLYVAEELTEVEINPETGEAVIITPVDASPAHRSPTSPSPVEPAQRVSDPGPSESSTNGRDDLPLPWRHRMIAHVAQRLNKQPETVSEVRAWLTETYGHANLIRLTDEQLEQLRARNFPSYEPAPVVGSEHQERGDTPGEIPTIEEI